MSDLTENLRTEEIIKLAEGRAEIPWKWGILLKQDETNDYAQKNGLILEWNQPIRPGDMYLAKRNTGYKLLSCLQLSEAFVIATTPAYGFYFSECVKVKVPFKVEEVVNFPYNERDLLDMLQQYSPTALLICGVSRNFQEKLEERLKEGKKFKITVEEVE